VTEIAQRALQCFAYPYQVVFVSNATLNVWQPLNSHHNFMVIHNGLETNSAETSGADVTVSKKPLVLAVGTLHPRKGYETLLRAFHEVLSRCPEAECWIVGGEFGDGSYARRLREMAANLGFASRFQITSCTLEELPDFLAAADVAVVPRPNSPGIPTKLLNYMAAGNAIVSFTRSATILQHKVTAFLVEPATAENLAQGILSVLDDPALAHKLRKNVQSFVIGRFDWPSIAVKLEAVYGSLARKSRAVLVDSSRAKLGY